MPPPSRTHPCEKISPSWSWCQSLLQGCSARRSERCAPGFSDLPGQLGEAIQGLGVAKRVLARGLLRRGSGEDLLDRHLELLAVEGLGYVRHSEDLVRHVPRRGVLADALLDPTLQVVVELGAFLEDYEEGHKGLAALPVDVYDQAILHLLDLLDGPVDLARPHPYAAAVYGRVGAPVDHAGAVWFDLDPVAVPPHPRVHVEVALPVALALRVVPEVDRHGGHRLRDDQLADLVDHGVAVLVEGLDLGPEGTRLQLPGADGKERDPADERGAQVRAAAGRIEPQVLLDVLVDPLEALRRQRRARRTDCL